MEGIFPALSYSDGAIAHSTRRLFPRKCFTPREVRANDKDLSYRRLVEPVSESWTPDNARGFLCLRRNVTSICNQFLDAIVGLSTMHPAKLTLNTVRSMASSRHWRRISCMVSSSGSSRIESTRTTSLRNISSN